MTEDEIRDWAKNGPQPMQRAILSVLLLILDELRKKKPVLKTAIEPEAIPKNKLARKLKSRKK